MRSLQSCPTADSVMIDQLRWSSGRVDAGRNKSYSLRKRKPSVDPAQYGHLGGGCRVLSPLLTTFPQPGPGSVTKAYALPALA
jgi:hypothetical protein